MVMLSHTTCSEITSQISINNKLFSRLGMFITDNLPITIDSYISITHDCFLTLSLLTIKMYYVLKMLPIFRIETITFIVR